MDKKILNMYGKLKEMLEDIPDEDECTKEENELYSNAQNLKESIECCIRQERSYYLQDKELNKKQLERIDEVHNAVFELCKLMLDNEDIEWDMEIIGECADTITDTLVGLGHPVHYPAIVYSDTGDTVEIVEWIYPGDNDSKHIEIII